MMTLPTVEELFAPNLDFETMAARVWEYQRVHNPVIAQYCAALGDTTQQFVPIRFFKDFEMRCDDVPGVRGWEPQAIFKSSGTTGQARSQHFVRDLGLYHQALLRGFRHFFGAGRWTVFALLPNYLEQGDSSLVEMVRVWMQEFGEAESGFYLHDFEALQKALVEAMDRYDAILLIGVSYALLDFAEQYGLALPPGAVVMETGGMKGRQAELTRSALHERLKAGFGLRRILSEYGMTELLSQAYSFGNERFLCPPWMRVVITDSYVPNRILPVGQAGRLNIIDLANLHSCAFIATDDLGRAHPDGSFEVLGRMDNAELRGCNLMYV